MDFEYIHFYPFPPHIWTHDKSHVWRKNNKSPFLNEVNSVHINVGQDLKATPHVSPLDVWDEVIYSPNGAVVT